MIQHPWEFKDIYVKGFYYGGYIDSGTTAGGSKVGSDIGRFDYAWFGYNDIGLNIANGGGGVNSDIVVDGGYFQANRQAGIIVTSDRARIVNCGITIPASTTTNSINGVSNANAAIGIGLINQGGTSTASRTIIDHVEFEFSSGGGTAGNPTIYDPTSCAIQIGTSGDGQVYDNIIITNNGFGVDGYAVVNNAVRVYSSCRGGAQKGNHFNNFASNPWAFVGAGIIDGWMVDWDDNEYVQSLSALTVCTGNGTPLAWCTAPYGIVANCTASGVPYPCCTGAGTGSTCSATPGTPVNFSLLSQSDIGEIKRPGRYDPRDTWQDLQSLTGATRGYYAGTGVSYVEDGAISQSGFSDAFLLTLTAVNSSAGGYYTVTGDGAVWEFSVSAEQYGATPLSLFQFQVYDTTASPAAYLSRVICPLQNYWEDYRLNVFMPSGHSINIVVNGWPGSGTVNGAMAHTKILVRKPAITGTLLYSGLGTVINTASLKPYPFSLPLGPFWYSGAGNTAAQYGTVIGRLDTTVTTGYTGSGAATDTIHVTSNTGVLTTDGEMVRIGYTATSGAQVMYANSTTGLHVTAVGSGTITITPGLPNGYVVPAGALIQIYRYAQGAVSTAWTP